MANRPHAPDQVRRPAEQEAGWVLLTEAATDAGCTEAWLLDRCHDGRLPSRTGAGVVVIVPLSTVRALVRGDISD